MKRRSRSSGRSPPHLEIRSLVGAGHTAASDVNDVFTETVVEFCLRTKEV